MSTATIADRDDDSCRDQECPTDECADAPLRGSPQPAELELLADRAARDFEHDDALKHRADDTIDEHERYERREDDDRYRAGLDRRHVAAARGRDSRNGKESDDTDDRQT